MSSQASENDSASSNPSGATSIFPYNYSSYSPPVASPPFAHLAADSQQAAAESLRAFLCSSGAAAGNGDFNGVATSEDAGTGLCGGLTSSSSSSSSPSSYAQTGALSSVCAPPPGIVSAARCSIEQLTEKAEKPGDASAPADDGSSSLETPANAGVSEHAKSPAVPSSLSSPSCLPPPSSNDPTGSADGTAGGISHSTKEDGDSCQQQVPSCEGGPNGAALGDSFRVLSRKRKADAFLPDGDAETMERLKRLMESLTREQMKLLLAKACVQYPGVFCLPSCCNRLVSDSSFDLYVSLRNALYTWCLFCYTVFLFFFRCRGRASMEREKRPGTPETTRCLFTALLPGPSVPAVGSTILFCVCTCSCLLEKRDTGD